MIGVISYQNSKCTKSFDSTLSITTKIFQERGLITLNVLIKQLLNKKLAPLRKLLCRKNKLRPYIT